jgi:hypothetical protein
MRLRLGFTLAEMLTSLLVLGAVVGLTTHAIVGQLRLLGGIVELDAMRGDLTQATGVVRAALRDASPSDIVAAQDSALELRTTIGSAVVCSGTPGVVTIAAASGGDGNTLAGFSQAPDVGDRVMALFDDSTGTTWLSFDVADVPAASACPVFADAPAGLRLTLNQPVMIPAGSVVRLLRPMRLSLYRASDGKWYLGGRDWNGTDGRLNTIQPIAGPLRPFSRTAGTSGLSFTYGDASGGELAQPVDPSTIRTVTVVARGESRKPVRVGGIATTASGTVRDTLSATVVLRNPL